MFWFYFKHLEYSYLKFNILINQAKQKVAGIFMKYKSEIMFMSYFQYQIFRNLLYFHH